MRQKIFVYFNNCPNNSQALENSMPWSKLQSDKVADCGKVSRQEGQLKHCLCISRSHGSIISDTSFMSLNNPGRWTLIV